jgi:TfoX/Sxy family transcriptional regulator of competence genes
MAFDEDLAARIRTALARKKGVEEKKMFGGVVFMLDGNMLVGVWKDSLIVRLGDEQAEAALLEPHVRPFDITGQPMKRWAMVTPDGVRDDDLLKEWIQRAVKFVGKLPAK